MPGKYVIAETEGGARSLSGAATQIQGNRTTDERCNVGDLIKYVNIQIEVAGRVIDDANQNSWLEWAFVCKREADADIPITQVGTQTLGDIATNMYRNECIYTGMIPIGINQGNGQNLMIKLPKTKQYLRLGDTFVIFTYIRSSNSVAASTTSHRLIQSFNFKCYH